MRDIDCTTEEFKALLEAVKELEKMEVEKSRILAFPRPPDSKKAE
jgi:hypothetical protein